MPTIASTMPSRRLSPRQVSRKRPRLWRMSLSARFTSRPARGWPRRAAFTQIRTLVHHDGDAGRQARGHLHAPVEQPLAELHAPLGQAAILDNPHRAGAAVKTLDEFQRDEQAARDHRLHDLDLGLLAQETELVLGLAGAAAHIDPALPPPPPPLLPPLLGP